MYALRRLKYRDERLRADRTQRMGWSCCKARGPENLEESENILWERRSRRLGEGADVHAGTHTPTHTPTYIHTGDCLFPREITVPPKTIVGGDRERPACPRRGRGKTVCARGAWSALLGGPSTSPLDNICGLSKRR